MCDRAVIQTHQQFKATKRLDFCTARSALQINLTQRALEILHGRRRIPSRSRSGVRFGAYVDQKSGHLPACTLTELLMTSQEFIMTLVTCCPKQILGSAAPCFASLVTLWLSAQIGASFRQRRPNAEEAERENFGVVVAATLTLLAIIIGFSFSMASSRYDQRKTSRSRSQRNRHEVRAGRLSARSRCG